MSKSSIRIPEGHREAFKILLNLPKEIIDDFISIIHNAPIGTTESGFYTLLIDNLNNLSASRIREIYSVYVSLSHAKKDLELTENEFIDDIANALIDTEDEDLIPSKENLIMLSDIFKSNKSVNASRKIESEYVQNENNFASSKVLTDIRPVFDEDEFLGSTILNRLKISFVHEGEEKDFYVTLDESDIQDMIDSLKNVQINNNYLRDNFTNLNIVKILK